MPVSPFIRDWLEQMSKIKPQPATTYCMSKRENGLVCRRQIAITETICQSCKERLAAKPDDGKIQSESSSS